MEVLFSYQAVIGLNSEILIGWFTRIIAHVRITSEQITDYELTGQTYRSKLQI